MDKKNEIKEKTDDFLNPKQREYVCYDCNKKFSTHLVPYNPADGIVYCEKCAEKHRK